jgi:uncharacterized protein YceK
MKSKLLLVVTLSASGLLSGCATYYKVTDPQTDAVYYTDRLERQPSGVVVFKDARTNKEITLPASAIQEIPKEQFDTGRYSPAPAPLQQPTTRP